MDWANLPIGAGVAVLLIREVSRFIRERQGDQKKNGNSGDKSVEFWDSKMREIVYRELERHVLPDHKEMLEKIDEILITVKELRWRRRNDRTE